MHGEYLGVLIEGDLNDTLLSALGPEDLDDATEVLDCAAVGGDGVGGVFEQNDRVGLGGVGGKLLLGGNADPIGNAVRLKRKGRGPGKAEENN